LDDLETCDDVAGAARGHDEARAAYLTSAFYTGDVTMMVDTVSAVARVADLDRICEYLDRPRAELEQALSSDTIMDLATFVAVISALGLRLAVLPRLPSS
jgi:DNA-binding phage protein